MDKKYQPFEVEQMVQSMVILVDTREQKCDHIEHSLGVLKCPCERLKLNYGDYSCKYKLLSGEWSFFTDKVAIERKASLDELAGNFTKGRERFRKEFTRAVEDKAKIYLLLEESSYMNILRHKYRSQFEPNSFLATLWSWQEEFNFTITMLPNDMSGMYIKGTLFYALKKYLLELEV